LQIESIVFKLFIVTNKKKNMSEQSLQTRKDIETRIITNAWKDETYKQELLSNPKAVIEREFGVQLPETVTVHAMEENATSLYFVLPQRPELPEGEISDAELEAVAGGTSPFLIVGKAIKISQAVSASASIVATAGGASAATGAIFTKKP
jgi:hypothetical protein